MNLYFKNTFPKKKSIKLNYLAPNVLRSLYLVNLNKVNLLSAKKVYSRGSVIPNLYNNCEVAIHRGNKMKVKHINTWMVGFKFGEFT